MSDLVIPSNALRTRVCILFRDRFVRGIFLEGAEVTLDDARECVGVTRTLMGSGPAVPITIDLRRIRSQSSEARAYLAGPDGAAVTPAVALIAGSPLSRAIGNFYLGFNRPPVPTRLFGDIPSAERWLDGYLPQLERVA